MKVISFCVAAVLLSSNVFAQAKPSDLSPTPMTQPTTQQSGKTSASPSSTATKGLHKGTHKHRAHAANSKRKSTTASIKARKKGANSVAR